MNSDPVKIVAMVPCKISVESDIFGSYHVVLQHEGHEPHTMVSLFYDYKYTSNGHIRGLAEKIAVAMGAVESVEIKNRPVSLAVPKKADVEKQIEELKALHASLKE